MITKTLRHYGFLGSIRLARDVIFSRIAFPKARIVRYPFYIRGGSGIVMQPGLTTGVGLRIDIIGAPGLKKLFIGRNVQLNDYVHIGAAESVTIGNNVLIASRVFITDHNHGSYSGENPSRPDDIQIGRPLSTSAVVIEDNVWIGEGAMILPGVRIGKNSIVGGGALVNKSVPANVIVAGSPARIVKVWNPVELVWEKPVLASLP